MMTDRPILFSAPMVRALLEGRKTQTRRVLKPPYGTLQYLIDGTWRPICTKFFPGDRLWVREAHALVPTSAYRISEGVAQAVNPADPDSAAIYREGFDRSTGGLRWRPGIHMPRWASRLTLTITDVRVQRLVDIGESDARAEGVKSADYGRLWKAYGEPEGCWVNSARTSFIRLWNSLHGPDAWADNPWVVALTFTVDHRNIAEVTL